jgi:predicted membrane chloride channel (bestrophin family)
MPEGFGGAHVAASMHPRLSRDTQKHLSSVATDNKRTPVTQMPIGVVGAAVTFLLVFRVNIAYERWYEGRKVFKDIVNHSRDLGRQICTHVMDWYIAEKMLRWLIVSVYMLKRHVREENYVVRQPTQLALTDSPASSALVSVE